MQHCEDYLPLVYSCDTSGSITSLYFELRNALFSVHCLDNSHFQRLSMLVHIHSRTIKITATRNVTKYTHLEQDNHRLLWLFCGFVLENFIRAVTVIIVVFALAIVITGEFSTLGVMVYQSSLSSHLAAIAHFN